MRWHALEEKLQSLCEGLGRKVMSREECWQVAESLGLDEASFDAALDFFHSMSLMFYFPRHPPCSGVHRPPGNAGQGL